VNLVKVIECVPNFSEGRDKKIIDALSEAIRSVEGVRLLDVEFDPDHNRSVFTFIGEPQPVKQAALKTHPALAKIPYRKSYFFGNFLIFASFVVLGVSVYQFFQGNFGLTDKLALGSVIAFIIGLFIRIVVIVKRSKLASK